MSKKLYHFIFILLIFSISNSAFAERFIFKYTQDDSYKIQSEVEEDVFVNSVLNHHAQIMNRGSVNITEVNEDGSAILQAKFMTSEKSAGGELTEVYTWGEEYDSSYKQNKFGQYEISDLYFMPTVRSVPTFPDKDIQIGETWTSDAHEAHDFRLAFGIEKPFRVPLKVNYKYEGIKEIDGKNLHIIKASYSNFFKTPQIQNKNPDFDYPKDVLGISDMTIYFDNVNGRIDSYNEKFKITITTQNNTKYVFKGNANAKTTYFEKVKNTETLEKVQEKIAEMGIENTDVKTDEKGITISLENIQFKPNSSELLESEKEKLKKIGEILSSFPNNDVLVTGHTALSGSLESCQILSEQRANAVAKYLINLGCKDSTQIFTKGMGASKPIAPNTSSQGMAKNRRVELTILQE